jgi:hypothetical protein
MRYFHPLILLTALTLLHSTAAEAAIPPVRCPIDRATYSAIGKSEFELQFSAIENPKIASEIVSLTLQHRDRGMLATYNLGGSVGYGSYYLRDLAKPIDAETDSNLKPVFFDTNWGNITDFSAIGSPKYLFISGLGANDWYSDRASNRTLPLGEVMWQFSGCRK